MPAAMPMHSEPSGPTKPDAGVMATRPATAPVQMPTTVGLPRIIHSTSIQVNAAVAVAMCVTVMAMPACMPALTAEPGVKPDTAAPQQRGPDEGEHHVVSRAGVFALAEDQARHQTRHAGIDVHDRAAGEVENLDPRVRVSGGEESVRPPDPVRDRRIDE